MKNINHNNEESEVKTNLGSQAHSSTQHQGSFNKNTCGCGCGHTHKAKPVTEEVIDVEEEWDY